MESTRKFAPAALPLRPGTKKALKKGPLTQYTPVGQDQIDEWLAQGLNVGYVTGPGSNAVVVDIDDKVKAAAFLAKHKDSLQLAKVVRTKNGWHFYFQHPGDGLLRTKIGITPGVDLLANPYIVAAPPSVSKGHQYRWMTDGGEMPESLPEMPESLLKDLQAMLDVRSEAPVKAGDDTDFGITHSTKMTYVLDDITPIEEGNRNMTLASAASEFISRSGSQDEVEIFEKLREVNSARCNPPLPDADLKIISASMARVDRRNHPDRVPKPRVETSEVAAVVDPMTLPKVLELGDEEDFGAEVEAKDDPVPFGDDADFGPLPVVEIPQAEPDVPDMMRPEYAPLYGAQMPGKKDSTNDCARWAMANVYHQGIMCLGDQYLVRDAARQVWQETPKACVTSCLLSVFDNAKARNDGIEYSVRNLSYFPRVDFPFWFNTHTSGMPPKGYPRDARKIIPFLNGLLNIETGKLLPHTPRYVSLAQMPFNYDPEAKCPEWTRCLGDWWGGPESDRALAVRRWFGYSLIPDCSQHKCLVIHGVRRSGKSTTAKILHALVGDHGTATTTLTHLTSSHGPSALVGKLLAIMYDAHLPKGGGSGGSTIEVLKSVIGNDPQPINRKFHDIYTARLSCRLMIVCNEIPRMDDAGNALLGRMIPIRCDNSFFGQEDTELLDRLLMELPGIANWAMQGLAEYRREKKLFMPREGVEDLMMLKRATNPVEAFIDDNCRIDGKSVTSTRELFTAWTAWCIQSNHRNVGSQIKFLDRVRSSHPSLRVAGIGLNEKITGIELLTTGKSSLV